MTTSRSIRANLLTSLTYKCAECDAEYTPTRLASKFCHSACQRKHSKRQHRQTDAGKAGLARQNATARDRKNQWARDNKDKVLANVRNYQARKRNALPVLSTEEKMAIKAIYAERQRISEETGVAHDVDHIKPLSKGGLHHPDNLRIITASLNRSKKDKWTD